MTIRRPGSLLIQNSDALCDRLLGHVPNGGVIYLHGVSCSGKSTLAAQVAGWAARRSTRVLYLDADEGGVTVARRLVRLGGHDPNILVVDRSVDPARVDGRNLVIVDGLDDGAHDSRIDRIIARAKKNRATVLVTVRRQKGASLILDSQVGLHATLAFIGLHDPRRAWTELKSRYGTPSVAVLLMTDHGLTFDSAVMDKLPTSEGVDMAKTSKKVEKSPKATSSTTAVPQTSATPAATDPVLEAAHDAATAPARSANDAFCDAFLGGVPRGSVVRLHGPSGVGKSTLAAQVACWAARHGTHVLYLTALESIDAVRRRFGRIGEPNSRVQIVATSTFSDAVRLFIRRDHARSQHVLLIADGLSQTPALGKALHDYAMDSHATVLVTARNTFIGLDFVDVDVALGFGGDSWRVWSVRKDRFGSIRDGVKLRMTDHGLVLDDAAPSAATPAATPEERETVESVLRNIRAQRTADAAAQATARANLRDALRKLSIDDLIERAVHAIMDGERLRREAGEWDNAREAGEGPKLWRSRYAFIETLATQLDSQRSRCSELQATLAAFGAERHSHENDVSVRIGEALARKDAEVQLEMQRINGALATERNRRERLELNLVTLLESLQLTGVHAVATGSGR